VCSSKLTRDQFGRLVCVTTSEDVGLPRGSVFIVQGNTIEAGGVTITWMGLTGRPPTLEERRGAREPYVAGAVARRRAAEREREDDELADEEAIELARIEQEKAPPDLIGAASNRAVYSLA
jgi:hypothetical protein